MFYMDNDVNNFVKEVVSEYDTREDDIRKVLVEAHQYAIKYSSLRNTADNRKQLLNDILENARRWLKEERMTINPEHLAMYRIEKLFFSSIKKRDQ